VQRVDARFVQFHVAPEQQHQLGRQLAQRGVVHAGLPLVQVVHEQVPHGAAFHVVAVDELLDGQLPAAAGRPDRRRAARRQNAGPQQQHVPVAVLALAVSGLRPVGLHAVGDGDVSEPAAVVDEDAGQLAVGQPAIGRS